MEIIVNISALKEDNEGVSINAVKSDLVEFGAIVRGAKDVDGDTLMLINGDVTVEDVENAFINIGVNVNDYIVEEDDLTITQTSAMCRKPGCRSWSWQRHEQVPVCCNQPPLG